MSGGVGKKAKKTVWHGQKKRCKMEGCKKRVRSYADIGICNKCVGGINKDGKQKPKHEKLK